jgi:hypothetical protein
MEQSEYYNNGYSDYMSGVPYRAPSMSFRLANSPWNEYDKGWAAAQSKVNEQIKEEERRLDRRFLSE